MNKIKKNLKFIVISVLLTCVSFYSTNIFALSSDWTVNDKSKVRLISSKTNSDNNDTILIGLEYELEPGWKTYWKSPGGGGFPQNVVWNNSENISQINIEWPTPTQFQILGLDSIGYLESFFNNSFFLISDIEGIANNNTFALRFFITLRKSLKLYT